VLHGKGLRQTVAAGRGSGTRDASSVTTSDNLEETRMSQQPAARPNSDDVPHENDVPKEIARLMTAIQELPAEHQATIEPALDGVVQSTKRRRRILNLVQEALSQLRLDMKYLVFDLEATRRERDDYRRQIEGS
jgi:hypothetical protein